MDSKKNLKQQKRFYISLIILAAVALGIVLNLQKVLNVFVWIWNVFKPLVIGGCIAFVMNILMDWLEKKVFTEKWIKRQGVRDGLSLMTSLLIIILLIIGILWVAIPQLITSFRLLASHIPTTIHEFTDILRSFQDRYSILKTIADDIDNNSQDFMRDAINYFSNILPETLTQTVSVASHTVGAVATFVIGLLFSLYILMYKHKLERQTRQLVYSYLPEKVANQTLYIAHLTAENFNGFIYGQCVEAIILALMYTACAMIFRLPYTFMIATVFAVFSLIPLFGAYIAWGIGVFLIVTVNPLQAITFTIIFIVVSQIEANLIYPRIVGSSIGLPGIWVLAAVTVGGNMLGIAGMLTAVPIVAVLYTVLSENSQKRLRSHPNKVEEIIHKPDWSQYNPETDKFESEPVHLENVFDQSGETIIDEPDKEPKKKKKKFFQI